MSGAAWIMTASGRAFYPLAPTPEQVHFPDVAHHLAQRNRFQGATREPYNVAQHCVLASLQAEEDARILVPNLGDGDQHVLIFALSVLLHDGAEAYGPDLSRPVKYSGAVEPLVRIEEAIQAAVYQAAGLPPVEPSGRPPCRVQRGACTLVRAGRRRHRRSPTGRPVAMPHPVEKQLCARCGHPDHWHSHADEDCATKHAQPCSPDTAPFRCLGYDCDGGGFPGGTPESRCGCPSFQRRSLPR